MKFTTDDPRAVKGRKRVMDACIELISALKCMPNDPPPVPPQFELLATATRHFWTTRAALRHAVLSFVEAGLIANVIAEQIDQAQETADAQDASRH